MAARPTWKGYLKISLVNIPIKVFPATDSGATLSFNQLHGECQTRIQQKRWCPNCQKEVANTDIVKGYEFEKGRYVVVGEEDIDKVRVESTRVINLEKFTDDTDVDPIYLERPYYLAPDGPVAKQAFAVIRDAMRGKGMVALGRLVLAKRERVIALEPCEHGLLGTTLRYPYEVRDAKDYFSDIPALPIAADMLKLAERILDSKAAAFDPATFHDRYEEALIAHLKARQAGAVRPPSEALPAPRRVINLMEALRRSIAQDPKPGTTRKPSPARKRA